MKQIHVSAAVILRTAPTTTDSTIPAGTQSAAQNSTNTTHANSTNATNATPTTTSQPNTQATTKQIFATQRGYGEWKDWWEFPGGKLEEGETAEQAIVREIGEELATKISVDRFLCTVEYDYPTFHLTMDCFLCRIIEGKLTLLEHENSAWLSLGDLDSVQWLPADIKVLEEVKKIL